MPKNDNREKIFEKAEQLRWDLDDKIHDKIMESLFKDASAIAEVSVEKKGDKTRFDRDRIIDSIVTSRLWGFPIMFVLLAAIFWITVEGANVPSEMLASLLIDKIHPALKSFTVNIGFPWWLTGLLIDGAYLASAWVIAVMLPPMAIFFPIFTLFEDSGYLPRVSFNLDRFFRTAGAHGKQALTMSMGFGCNAAGVVASRIIDSPRERLIAMITNNFSLCNGRWPTQILIATIFIGSAAPAGIAGLISAMSVVAVALFGVFLSFAVSWGLSNSILKGEASTFSLELPPYRAPKILQTLYTSLIDRTIFVLWRAVVFALPAGMVIWAIANIQIDGLSIAEHFINWSDPVGILLGLNGVILLAYIIAIPANEIVIPTILMLTVLSLGMGDTGSGAGVLFELDSLSATESILRTGGWSLLTGINLMLFSLLHNPCSTTIYTIYKESGSVKWAAVSALLPLGMGFIATFFVTQIWRLFS